jgi:hypothetical protein
MRPRTFPRVQPLREVLDRTIFGVPRGMVEKLVKERGGDIVQVLYPGR